MRDAKLPKGRVTQRHTRQYAGTGACRVDRHIGAMYFSRAPCITGYDRLIRVGAYMVKASLKLRCW